MKLNPSASLGRFLLRLLRDDRRGELLEYAVIAATITLIALALAAALNVVEAPIPVE